MTLDPVLFLNALVAGILLGAFYALAAAGLAVAFGLLDIVNIAHPAIMVAAAFAISALCDTTGLDPALTTLIVAAPPSIAPIISSSSDEATFRYEVSRSSSA